MAGATQNGETAATGNAVKDLADQITGVSDRQSSTEFIRSADARNIYDITGRYDPATGILAGRADITFSNNTSRRIRTLRFRLPVNRYAGRDKRFDDSWYDGQYPGQWQPGGIEILKITDGRGRKLPFSFRRFDKISCGTFDRGLLFVHLRKIVEPEDSTRIKISFKTIIPKRTGSFGRTGSGTSQLVCMTEEWYPALPLLTDDGWIDDRRPGADFTVKFENKDIRVAGFPVPAEDGSPGIHVEGLREFPVVLLPIDGKGFCESSTTYRGIRLVTVFRAGKEKLGGRYLRWTAGQIRQSTRLLGHCGRKTVTVVEIPGQDPGIFVSDGILLVTSSAAERSGRLGPLERFRLCEGICSLYWGEDIRSGRRRMYVFWQGMATAMALVDVGGLDRNLLIETVNKDFMGKLIPPVALRDFVIDLPLDRSADGPALPDLLDEKTDLRITDSRVAKPARVSAAAFILALRNITGPLIFDDILKTCYMKYRFEDIDLDDFFRIAGKKSGMDLEKTFKQALGGLFSVDFSVVSVQTKEKPEYVKAMKDAKLSKRNTKKLFGSGSASVWLDDVIVDDDDGSVTDYNSSVPPITERIHRYDTTVKLGRTGEIRVPVDVRIQLADGNEFIKRWDGDREVEMLLQTVSKVQNVSIDPKMSVYDPDRVNNNLRLSFERRRFYSPEGLALIVFPYVYWPSSPDHEMRPGAAFIFSRRLDERIVLHINRPLPGVRYPWQNRMGWSLRYTGRRKQWKRDMLDIRLHDSDAVHGLSMRIERSVRDARNDREIVPLKVELAYDYSHYDTLVYGTYGDSFYDPGPVGYWSLKFDMDTAVDRVDPLNGAFSGNFSMDWNGPLTFSRYRFRRMIISISWLKRLAPYRVLELSFLGGFTAGTPPRQVMFPLARATLDANDRSGGMGIIPVAASNDKRLPSATYLGASWTTPVKQYGPGGKSILDGLVRVQRNCLRIFVQSALARTDEIVQTEAWGFGTGIRIDGTIPDLGTWSLSADVGFAQFPAPAWAPILSLRLNTGL